MTDNTYYQVLAEFRADIFQRLSVIVAVSGMITGFILVFMKPLPHQLILALQIFGGFVIYTRHLAQERPDFARRLFVISLYIILALCMVLLPISWLPFLVAPLLFISELLAARVSVIACIGLLLFAGLLVEGGYAEYPLPILVLFTGFVFVVANGSMRTIWLLLHWYRSMFSRSSALLEETRAHRAELSQTLKSLEIAQDTQKRLQTQLIYARQQAEEARRLKERFASNISHELRTPLNVILGFTEIMHLTPEVYGDVHFPPKLQQDIYQIHRNSRHLLDMIDDVLDLSHIELTQFTLNFEQTELVPFLRDTVGLVENLFQNKPVEFVVTIAEDLPAIQIDRTRIRQVIINLINNAQRFTAKGNVTFCVYAAENNVVFQVADTGIGISSDQIHLIFDEFFQVDYSLSRANGGAGLGLAITRRFIEAHNGHLQVESQEGVGSVFTFTLPLPRLSPVNRRLPQISNGIKSEAMWLVVDADPQVSKLIQRHLRDCSIIQIDRPDQIGDALHRYSPQGIIFNTAYDDALPDELGDFSIPIVTCSLPSTTQMVKRLGVDACLSKPVLPEQLTQQLQAYDDLKTILVIDDDVGVVQLVQRALENRFSHLTVQRAYDGQQACEMMNHSPPDLVLLDLAMPAMSGFEVIAMMKATPKLQAIPIILLTATKYIYSDDETRGELHIYRQDGLKPMEVLGLLNMIVHTMNSPYATPSSQPS